MVLVSTLFTVKSCQLIFSVLYPINKAINSCFVLHIHGGSLFQGDVGHIFGVTQNGKLLNAN